MMQQLGMSTVGGRKITDLGSGSPVRSLVGFTHKMEAQTLKSLDDFTEGSIHGELGH